MFTYHNRHGCTVAVGTARRVSRRADARETMTMEAHHFVLAEHFGHQTAL